MQKTLNEYLEIGAQHYLSGKLHEASRVWSEGLRYYPRSSGLLNNLATVQSELKDFQSAIRTYKEALLIEPKSAVFVNNLAIAQKDFGETSLAIKNLKKALVLDPNLEDPYYNLGNIYREKKYYKKAIKFYKISLEKNNLNPKAWNNLGITWRDLGQLEKAKMAFEKGLSIDPNYQEIYISYFVTLQELCLWKELNNIYNNLTNLIIDPFFSITYLDSPLKNLEDTRNWNKFRFNYA